MQPCNVTNYNGFITNSEQYTIGPTGTYLHLFLGTSPYTGMSTSQTVIESTQCHNCGLVINGEF